MNMKPNVTITVTTKMRIKILFVIISLILPIINLPAVSAVEAGEVADFQMWIEAAEANILGTVVYRSGYADNITNTGAMNNDIDQPIDIYLSSVKQYDSTGGMAELSRYYWTVKSNNEDIAEVELQNGYEVIDYADNYVSIGSEAADCYLTLTPKSIGTAVISVNMAANINTLTGELIKPVTKTFTIMIVDAAKHSEAEPIFVRNGGASIPADAPLHIGYTTETTISIHKLVSYDYSSLNSGSYTKDINNYTWHASLDSTDVIKINDAYQISSQTVKNGNTEKDSTKNIVITPLQEGTVDINFTFAPTDSAVVSIVGSSIEYTQTVNVTKVVGSFDFKITSDKKAYRRGIPESEYYGDEEDEFNFGMSLQNNVAFAGNNNFEPDINSDVDMMFQKPPEPTTEAPTEPYDLNSDVDIMYQNRPTTAPTEKPTNPPAGTNNNKNNNNNNKNFEPDLNSDIDVMFQKAPEPTTPAPTEPYDLNSDVDIMFQNRPTTAPTEKPTNPPAGNSNNKNNNNFEPDLNSDVDMMFQRAPEPTTPEPTEPYDLNSPVDIMFQNKSSYADAGNNNHGASGLSNAAAVNSTPNFTGTNFNTSEVTVGGDREASLIISELRAQINGEWTLIDDDIPFEIKEISYKYPTLITDSSAKKSDVTEVKITDEYELDYYNAAFYNDGEIELFIEDIEVQTGFDVIVSIKAEIYGDVKTASKPYNILFITDEDDGAITDISIMQDWEIEIADKQTISGIIGRNQTGSLLEFVIDSIDIVDFTEDDNIYTLYDLSEYEFAVDSSSLNIVGVIVPDLSEEDSSTFKLELKRTGKANIAVKVTSITDPTKTYMKTFTVNVTDGVPSSEEGAIASVLLKHGQEKIYNGGTLYMLPDSELKIDIDKVLEFSSAAKASDNYTRELKTYKWLAGSDSSVVNIDNSMGGNITSDSLSDDKTITIVSDKITGEATVVIALESERADITSKSAYFFSFKVVVNGIGGNFLPVIDYEQETVRIAMDVYEGNYLFYEFDQDRGPEYMYCLKAVSDGSSQEKEKWYPFMGSEMDISALVPKSGSSAYRLGIRLANDVQKEEDGNYSSANRRVALIPPRRVLTKAEKSEIVYKNEQIMLSLPGSEAIDIYYQVGLSGWLKATISGNSGISFPSSIAPMGVVVEIKYAAVPSDSENKEGNFGSVPVKIKVPKAGAKPNIRGDDQKASYTGFSAKMEYSVDGMNWSEAPKGAIAYKDLAVIFGEAAQDTGSERVIYIRTKASYKNDGSLKSPASDIVALKIPASVYN